MEATIVYWGYIGRMEEENGSYYSILGSYLGEWKREWKP